MAPQLIRVREALSSMFDLDRYEKKSKRLFSCLRLPFPL
jgi:hypothetical protein